MLPPSPLDPNGRISRRDLALNGPVWLTYGLMFALAAICTAGIPVLWPQFSLVRLELFAAALAIVAITACLVPPPRMDSWQNHLALGMIPAMTAIGVVVFAPSGIVPIAAATFAGTLTAGRVQDRRHLLAHYVVGAAITMLPLLLVDLDHSATLGLLSVVPGVWTLGYCTMLILEAAEAQGEELERLIRRDPLTGLGNRRMLMETLSTELDRGCRAGRPVAILAIDLNGFKALNDEVGHEAGDLVLQQVAQAIASTLRPGDAAARQGGDEFCISLPGADAAQAEAFSTRLRAALGGVVAARPITSGIGVAVFPADATTADGLLSVADARLAADKPRSRPPAACALTAPSLSVAARPRLTAVDPSSSAEASVAAGSTRVSREDIAVSRTVWVAIGGMTSLYSLVAVALALVVTDQAAVALPVSLALAAVAIVVVLREPPGLDSWLNHAVVAIPYVGSLAFAAAMPAYAGGMFGALALTGALAAVRLVRRGAIAAHLSAATAGILGLVLLGDVPPPLMLGLLLMVPVIWASSFGSLTFLEVAEHQGEALEALVRRDPLTGAGNRRLLAERLDVELRRHARTRRPMSVLALDLNGFKDLNDDLGHAAGDDLLKRVAARLDELSRPGDTVVRQGGDEFCVLMPETSAEGAVPIANAVRAAIARLGTLDHPISTGVGTATYPLDATAGDVLLHVADWRLRDEKQSTAYTRPRRARSGRVTSPLQRLQ